MIMASLNFFIGFYKTSVNFRRSRNITVPYQAITLDVFHTFKQKKLNHKTTLEHFENQSVSSQHVKQKGYTNIIAIDTSYCIRPFIGQVKIKGKTQPTHFASLDMYQSLSLMQSSPTFYIILSLNFNLYLRYCVSVMYLMKMYISYHSYTTAVIDVLRLLWYFHCPASPLPPTLSAFIDLWIFWFFPHPMPSLYLS